MDTTGKRIKVNEGEVHRFDELREQAERIRLHTEIEECPCACHHSCKHCKEGWAKF